MRESERKDNLPWCKYIVPRGTAHLGAVQLDPAGHEVRQASVNLLKIVQRSIKKKLAFCRILSILHIIQSFTDGYLLFFLEKKRITKEL